MFLDNDDIHFGGNYYIIFLGKYEMHTARETIKIFLIY